MARTALRLLCATAVGAPKEVDWSKVAGSLGFFESVVLKVFSTAWPWVGCSEGDFASLFLVAWHLWSLFCSSAVFCFFNEWLLGSPRRFWCFWGWQRRRRSSRGGCQRVFVTLQTLEPSHQSLGELWIPWSWTSSSDTGSEYVSSACFAWLHQKKSTWTTCPQGMSWSISDVQLRHVSLRDTSLGSFDFALEPKWHVEPEWNPMETFREFNGNGIEIGSSHSSCFSLPLAWRTFGPGRRDAFRQKCRVLRCSAPLGPFGERQIQRRLGFEWLKASTTSYLILVYACTV